MSRSITSADFVLGTGANLVAISAFPIPRLAEFADATARVQANLGDPAVHVGYRACVTAKWAGRWAWVLRAA